MCIVCESIKKVAAKLLVSACYLCRGNGVISGVMERDYNLSASGRPTTLPMLQLGCVNWTALHYCCVDLFFAIKFSIIVWLFQDFMSTSRFIASLRVSNSSLYTNFQGVPVFVALLLPVLCRNNLSERLPVEPT